jgi:hypothetical protein
VRCDDDFLDIHALHAAPKVLAVDLVAVAKEIARWLRSRFEKGSKPTVPGFKAINATKQNREVTTSIGFRTQMSLLNHFPKQRSLTPPP